jgi:hypothetical protein
MAECKWSVQTKPVEAFAASELANRSNNTRVLGREFVNSSERNRFMDLFCRARFQTAPPSGAYIGVYLIPAMDETTWVDGSSSVPPQESLMLAAFQVRQSTSQQILAVTKVIIPPVRFRLLWLNSTQVTTTANVGDNQVFVRFYNEEVL